MRDLVRRYTLLAFVSILCLFIWSAAAQQNGTNSIGGTVINNASGRPEAGVWVTAETKSLQVPFRKIVVTDDQGRFLVPDLPRADYELWARGYGLKDSNRSSAALGSQARLVAGNASSPQEAAKTYS